MVKKSVLGFPLTTLLLLILALNGDTAAASPVTTRDNEHEASSGFGSKPDGGDVSDGITLKIQSGHSEMVTSVDFSFDGRFMVTGSVDGTTVLWDANSGAEIRKFTQHTGSVNSARFAPNSYLVLTGSSDETARLWDSENDAQLQVFRGHSGAVTSVAFSANGEFLLTGSADQKARMWRMNSGVEVGFFEGHTGAVSSVALSPSGEVVVTASIADGSVRWWSASTGKELRRRDHSGRAVSLSRDGKGVLTGRGERSSDYVFGERIAAQLWSESGFTQRFDWPRRMPFRTKVLGSADWAYPDADVLGFCQGVHSILAATGRQVLLWDAITMTPIQVFNTSEVEDVGLVSSFACSPDGERIVIGTWDGAARLWDTSTGKQIREFRSEISNSVMSLDISSDGRLLATGDGYKGSSDFFTRVWDLNSNAKQQRLSQSKTAITSVKFSPDGHTLLSASPKDYFFSLWSLTQGVDEPLHRTVFSQGTVLSASFSPNGQKRLAIGTSSRKLQVWDTFRWNHLYTISDIASEVVAFSPDGKYVLSAGSDKITRIWKPPIQLFIYGDLAEETDAEEIQRFEGHEGAVLSVAFSSDERLLTGSNDYTGRIWGVESGEELVRLIGHSGPIASVAFSSNDEIVLTGSGDGTARLWNSSTGDTISILKGHSSLVYAVSFLPGDRFAVIGSQDGTIRVCEVPSLREVLRLFSLRDGSVVAVTPDGRFDTNNLEEIKGLHWVMLDDPLRALPLEIFMRDYYQPRLLPRVLAGETLPSIPSLTELNRAQPQVEIKEVRVENKKSGLVNVTVEVSNQTLAIKRENKPIVMHSSVFDLRLFRNGQLVAQFPEPKDEASIAGQTREKELGQWRRRHQIQVNSQNGKKVITFPGIRLPRRADLKSIEFSAYAFNEDRVKSATARYEYELPQALPTVKGRAYLINIGVNEFENSAWDLTFAAQDARRIQEVLSDRLMKSKQYQKIVPIPLLSADTLSKDLGQLSKNDATKAKIMGVLDLLAGRPVEPELKQQIPRAKDLQPARPEDLVLLSFSSHGHTDKDGTFYFFPSDIGKGHGRTVTQKLLDQTISSNWMAEWLQDIDAGELIMIVDACHSAATVEAGGFKPGPMGSRGLGQLAYDKGMRILVASQAEDVALESRLLKQGLLSYALVQDGLEAQKADFQPKDDTIFLKEWLEYAVERVPNLYEEVQTGTFTAKGVTSHFGASAQKLGQARAGLQQPSLFDFRKTSRDVVVSQLPPVTNP